MTRNRALRVLLTGISAALPLLAAAAADRDQMPKNDLREFRIGETVASLPKKGYLDFACPAAPDTQLQGWADYKSCPAGEHGLHAVAFRYDGSANPRVGLSEDAEKTEVAGQPVLLQLLIDDTAHLAGIRITTDPAVRLRARRGAHLFGEQAKARYGETGWQCTQGTPTATEQPVGGVFVKERCEKKANGRRYFVERDLHRDPSLDLSHFVSTSTVLVLSDRVRN